MDKPFYILAVDGGGIRGVYPAYILNCIQNRLQVRLLDRFDMLAGTSTGAIIAGAIASNINTNKIVWLYKEHGQRIFSPKTSWYPEWIKPAFHSRYQSDELYKVLDETFGETRLGQISKPLLIPATDVGNGAVYVFKSGYSKDFARDGKTFIKKAVMASCSAPTFFDPIKVEEYLLADGGVWANNPALAAVIDAQKRLGIKLENIKILSIGTGHPRQFYGVNPDRKWGLLKAWGGHMFIDFLLSLQAQSAHNYLQLLLKPEQIVRLDFESDNPLPLDNYDEIDNLISRADREFTHNSESLNAFLKDD